jgi:hypothetical protein
MAEKEYPPELSEERLTSLVTQIKVVSSENHAIPGLTGTRTGK